MIKIIDYRAGNAPSVLQAVTHLGYSASFIRHPRELADATHIILPGVGSARATMESLREMGLIEVMMEAVLHRKVFFLGICVGLQILFEHSDEDNSDCLGWLSGKVVKFDASTIRVPQMGWNRVSFPKGVPVKTEDSFFYFVNSYYAVPDNPSVIWGTADYAGNFTAAVRSENIYAVQFHAEKSGIAGLSLLNGFLRLGGSDSC